MGRQYVHLSVDKATAEQVGRRKAEVPILLAVNADEAFANGIAFYLGNDLVWLADFIPAAFIE
jgi:putative RNA 2'-phosphotransferase